MPTVNVETGNGPRAYFSSGLQADKPAFHSIPVIDFAPMRGTDADAKRTVGEAVRTACTEVGFFYATNHGVPQEAIDRTFSAAHRFFAQPMEVKQSVSIEASPAMRGYGGLLAENTDPNGKGDFHEGFDLALDLDDSDPDVKAGIFGYAPNQWPDGVDGFREALTGYHSHIIDFGHYVFEAFAIALELDPDFFKSFVTKPMAHMRVLHYPPQDAKTDEKQIGIGAHSDYECFTVLCTDEKPALQVLNTEGAWIQAPPIEGAFVVNVGDLMARWTNDYFKSTVHRAINLTGKQRYSIPFFFGPNSTSLIDVLPSCQSPDNPPKYAPITAGDYIKSRFDDTYEHRRDDDS